MMVMIGTNQQLKDTNKEKEDGSISVQYNAFVEFLLCYNLSG